jgi:sodium transport system ATP-binding protein
VAEEEVAVVADGLRRRYDDVLAVDGVSFAVRRGEVYGLLGPNGAGKTTVLRMLAGVLIPDAGSASILGHDVVTDTLAAKRVLGFSTGDTRLYARLTVREVLQYFARLAGLDDDAVRLRVEIVERRFGLSEFIDQKTGALSSGQSQRANLARAFMTDPSVLVLDEPTATLDVVSGRFVHEAIREARAEGKAVLLSTHLMNEAAELCDRIGLLVRGRIRAEGTHDALLAEHGQPNLTELILALHEESAA